MPFHYHSAFRFCSPNDVSLTIVRSDAQSAFPKPVASPGNMLKMQFLKPHFRFPESETLWMVPNNLCFRKHFR